MIDIRRLANLSPEKRAFIEERIAARNDRRSIPRRQPEDPCPLSFSQHRLWFLDQMEPGNAAYNVYRAVRLRGELNGAALRRALTEVQRRHEVLRTAFPVIEGAPVQCVAAPAEVSLPLFNLSSLPPEERQPEALRIAAEEAKRSFDLASGPPFRARLLLLGPQEHILLVTAHHIAVDGWSVGILFREIAALYGAYSKGLDSPLSEPPIQFADYALWERTLLSGTYLDQLVGYWKEQLDGAPQVLRLPIDRYRPAVLTSAGGRYYLDLPNVPLERLKTIARAERATVFMGLLAAFGLLLSRYSGQSDLLIGSPMACRDLPELEGLIGCFSNTLVLRLNLRGDPTYRELLRQVREMTLGALAHQRMPFDKLVETLKPERDPSRMLMVQVNFRLVNAPLPPAAAAGLAFEFLPIDNEGSKFDLALQLHEELSGLGGFLEYSSELFQAETMPFIASDFADLLAVLAAQPEVPFSKLDFCPRLKSGRGGPSLAAVRRKPIYVGREAVSPEQQQSHPAYELRPATLKDSAFIYDLRVNTMSEFVARVPGWTKEYQEAYYTDFDLSQHQIILVDGEAVGALCISQRASEDYLANIHLLPRAQGRGLGTAIVREAISQAHARGVPLTAQVLKGNATSIRMFERAGLTICGQTPERYRFIASLPATGHCAE
jgi:ribosomal protein S18 acetylase RimI-like enzyme